MSASFRSVLELVIAGISPKTMAVRQVIPKVNPRTGKSSLREAPRRERWQAGSRDKEIATLRRVDDASSVTHAAV